RGGIAMKPNVISVLLWGVGAAIVYGLLLAGQAPALLVGVGALFFLAGLGAQIARQWEKAIVLRLGRFQSTRGPGLFFIVPFIDSVAFWVDQRVIATSFTAEQTLTRDTVPVNVDAVLFWHVHDAQRAALEVQGYSGAVALAAQTALRDLIG